MRTVPGPRADRRTRETGGGPVIQNGWTTVSFSRYFSKIIIIHCTLFYRIAIAYCNLEFQALKEDTPKPSYVFHIGDIFIWRPGHYDLVLPAAEDPTTASLELQCPNHLVSCEYSPKEASLLAGGCYNGQVCYWDDRSDSTHLSSRLLQLLSKVYILHEKKAVVKALYT